MLRCREVTRLVSDSMDRRLPLGPRIRVRFHLLMCRFCSGFARQLAVLRQAVRSRPEQLNGLRRGDGPAKLPDAARQRINKALRGDPH